MDKNKLADKLKEGVSVQELEDFARKHTTEVFSVLALIIGAISSAGDFFTGPGLTVIFTALGAIASIVFPVFMEKWVKQAYSFSFKQEKTTEMILGGVKLVVALFVPFLYFGVIGILAGTSYHYYIRHAQIANENKPTRTHHQNSSGEEHD